MKYLLDTNTCIKFLNGTSPSIKDKLSKLKGKVFLCSVVKAELVYGAMKSQRVAENMSRLNILFDNLSSFPFDDNCVEFYGKMRADLVVKGQTIGANDYMIASIAMANNLTLVTHNTREFERIQNLKLEDWEE